MKIELHCRFLISLLFILISSTLFAQNPIPNAGLESWSGNTPDGWSVPTNIPLAGIEPVIKSAEAYSDSWAARGIVIDVFGTPATPVLYTGTISNPLFPVAANHSLFTCFYKYFPVGGDALLIEIEFLNLNISGGGYANIEITAENSSVYNRFDAPIVYDPGNPTGWQATHANITITIKPPTGGIPHAGTWFLVDHFMFDNLPITAIQQSETETIPEKFGLEQNYPNPFNPSTNISFSIPIETFVNLEVFNVQGELVATLVDEQLAAGTYSTNWTAENVSSGMYFYFLKANEIVLSKKMLLIK
jgi:hypothetical protein